MHKPLILHSMNYKATDGQILEVIRALNGFKLLKYTKMRREIIERLSKEKNYYVRKKLEAELSYVLEKRDEAASMLSLTID